jgi:hypothetical protein
LRGLVANHLRLCGRFDLLTCCLGHWAPIP